MLAYYPTARVDVMLASPTAIPAVGDLLCYAVAPLVGEAMAPRMVAQDVFAPTRACAVRPRVSLWPHAASFANECSV